MACTGRTIIKDYDMAIQVEPKYAEAYYERGIAHIATNNRELGEKDLRQAIKIYGDDIRNSPHDAMPYVGRAFIYFYMQMYDKAINDYTSAIKYIRFAQHGYLYKMRGDCYKAIGDNPKAQADYAKAAEIGNPYQDGE